MCYLVLVLNERPQFALGLGSRLLFALSGVGQAGFRCRPLHGLAVVLKLNVSRWLEPGLIGLHNLVRVLVGGGQHVAAISDSLTLNTSFLLLFFGHFIREHSLEGRKEMGCESQGTICSK